MHNTTPSAAEFRKMLEDKGTVVDFVTGSLEHLQIDRAYAVGGDTVKAKMAYQDFLVV